MEEILDFEQLVDRANEKILLAKELNKMMDNFIMITGAVKIKKKILQESKFLEKVIKDKTLKLNHVQCSNLTHYEFLVKILKLQRDVVHLDCAFPMNSRDCPLRVDIVCESGLKWIKAVARNSKSLSDTAKGDASYGSKSILDHGKDFVEAAAQHLYMFKPPKVCFYFIQEIDKHILDDLQKIGVETLCTYEPPEINNSEQFSNISTLNLDTTTLLGYVSSLCNGSDKWIFKNTVLSEQSEKERETPLKPVLDKLFEGKRLICCETAEKSFKDIINILGGPHELKRAHELLRRIEVLPDISTIPEILNEIKLNGKITDRSFKVFAFGMQMKAVTVSSNKAFVRSAQMQGVNVPSFIHQARALTESKENTATPLS